MKNTSRSKTSRTAEERFVCENWDEPEVNITSHGRGCSPARKVSTPNGRRQIDATDLLDEAHGLLRAGFEVRLTSERFGEAIRLIPMMATDLATMQVYATAMGGFRDKTLADKRARLVRLGKEVSAQAAAEYMRAKRAETPRRAETPPEAEVTPDSTVKCPKCGARFRVGRRIAA